MDEARDIFKQIEEVIDGGKEGTYGVYVEEQKKIIRKVVVELEG